MKIYTIIAGVNGVGKSSFFGVLCGIRSDVGSLIDESQINSSIEKGINFTQETYPVRLKDTQNDKTGKRA